MSSNNIRKNSSFNRKYLFVSIALILSCSVIGVFIQKVYASENGLHMFVKILPNFQVSFDAGTANVTTNMKVVINGEEVKPKEE